MYIDKKNFIKSLANYSQDGPFDHCVIDNFFNTKIANKLEKEFPSFNSENWHIYDNALEIKKTCNNWNAFPPLTYQVFNYLNSEEFISLISKKISKRGKALYAPTKLQENDKTILDLIKKRSSTSKAMKAYRN